MEKRKILIIDDAKEVTRILRFHLEKKYSVLEAHDGKKGLEMIFKEHPDLVILDINLPKMSGIELYEKMTSGKGKPLIPVIVLTVREELGQLFREMDADGFITKPFDVEKVTLEVDTVIEKKYSVGETVPRENRKANRLLLVEDDPAVSNRIATEFLGEGFMMGVVKSGLEAIERILEDPPDALVIKTDLPDITGDLISARLKQMPRTSGMPLILYAAGPAAPGVEAAKKIGSMLDIEFVETDVASVLLDKMKQILVRKITRNGND
jgi:DNA-binding response OmpR family regulator